MRLPQPNKVPIKESEDVHHEVESLAKTFKTRERAAGLTGSLHSFIAPRYRQREAVKPISFSLEPGELLAFIGPNGAGKSTTIKMLSSSQYPCSQ
jgi:ABC-2 type transport system ATP-binding protein